MLALAIFDGPIQSGFDQLSQDLTNSVSNIGRGGGVPPLGAIPEEKYILVNAVEGEWGGGVTRCWCK